MTQDGIMREEGREVKGGDNYQLGSNVVFPCASLASFRAYDIPLVPYKGNDLLWRAKQMKELQCCSVVTSSKEKNTRGGSDPACCAVRFAMVVIPT